MRKAKKIIIIAGPNGAGKTTFALEFLPKEANCPVFVNADLIAAGISPFMPESASFHDIALIKSARFTNLTWTSPYARGKDLSTS